PHQPRHHARHLADDPGHHAPVIEDREERGHEDDRRQHLERDVEGRALLAEIAEDEGRAREGVAEEARHDVARPREEAAAEIDAEDEDAEDELETEAPGHRASPDRLSVRGEDPAEREYRE